MADVGVEVGRPAPFFFRVHVALVPSPFPWSRVWERQPMMRTHKFICAQSAPQLHQHVGKRLYLCMRVATLCMHVVLRVCVNALTLQLTSPLDSLRCKRWQWPQRYVYVYVQLRAQLIEHVWFHFTQQHPLLLLRVSIDS